MAKQAECADGFDPERRRLLAGAAGAGACMALTSAANLVVSLPEAHAGRLFDWFDMFVKQLDPSRMREGLLELTSRANQVLAYVHFPLLGISRIDALGVVNRGGPRIVRAEMFCDIIKLDLSALA